MLKMLLGAVVYMWPIGHFYSADPDNRVPILPTIAVPRAAGGLLPPPGPPSDRYIQAALAGAGRQPGDVIVTHRLVRERVGVPRFYRGVGHAAHWELSYRCDVVGPDGPYTIYVDRNAMVLVPR
jgi:hypothetical protein